MHDASGKWIGWGLGGLGDPPEPPDDDPKVQGFKRKLKAKFAKSPYHGSTDDSTVYTDELATEVARVQAAWGFPPTGVIDYKFQQRAGWVAPPKARRKPLLFTVHGTGQPDPEGPGLPVDTARQVADKYQHQGIGNYPAAPFPMWPSIMQGLDELNLQTSRGDFAEQEINVAGYSQGAIVVGLWLKHSVGGMNGGPPGPLFHLKERIRKVVLWGNPMRQPGWVHWDGWLPAAPATLDNGGILEDRLEGLEHEPYRLADYAHKDDMYSCCPFDDMGENERAICKIIMGNNVFGGPDSILSQLWELASSTGAQRWREVMAVYHALLDAGMFFGGGTKAHGYNIGPAVDFLRED